MPVVNLWPSLQSKMAALSFDRTLLNLEIKERSLNKWSLLECFLLRAVARIMSVCPKNFTDFRSWGSAAPRPHPARSLWINDHIMKYVYLRTYGTMVSMLLFISVQYSRVLAWRMSNKKPSRLLNRPNHSKFLWTHLFQKEILAAQLRPTALVCFDCWSWRMAAWHLSIIPHPHSGTNYWKKMRP